jgi:glutamate-1-semialdehyde 2,1-aminomutase
LNDKMNNISNEELFTRAKRVMPGGVNSPVRAFGAVGGTPHFIRSSDGSKITDTDGNTYIDYVASWGPMILGHNHPAIRSAVEKAVKDGLSFGAPCAAEVELAELICELVPGLEQLRMTSSGTEAVMSAVRVARHVTGRSKLLKFEGCYHGHSDGMLVKAGSGALTFGTPDSGGVPDAVAALTLTAEYNDLSSVYSLFAANAGEIAAVIIEPIAANMGVIPQSGGFLRGLKDLCCEYGALLIFDEVITGFRLAPGGAVQYFSKRHGINVQPDLYAFGKIIGGGMPVGAFGGSREIMSKVAPLGAVYQAGTLSGNPIAMAAGLAQLRYLREHPEIYETLDIFAVRLADGLKKAAGGLTVNHVGSLLTLFFSENAVDCYATAKASDTAKFARFFHGMLKRGIYLPPSQFEAWFISAAHSTHDLDLTILAAKEAFAEL